LKRLGGIEATALEADEKKRKKKRKLLVQSTNTDTLKRLGGIEATALEAHERSAEEEAGQTFRVLSACITCEMSCGSIITYR
jgi:hypothetical protein